MRVCVCSFSWLSLRAVFYNWEGKTTTVIMRSQQHACRLLFCTCNLPAIVKMLCGTFCSHKIISLTTAQPFYSKFMSTYEIIITGGWHCCCSSYCFRFLTLKMLLKHCCRFGPAFVLSAAPCPCQLSQVNRA